MHFVAFILVMGALAEWGRSQYLRSHGISLEEYYSKKKPWPRG